MVGAIDKTVVKFGMPVDSVVPTTTFAQAQSMLAALEDMGVKELSAHMSGWSNGGVTQKVFSNVRVQRQLGGEKGMASVIAAADNLPLP